MEEKEEEFYNMEQIFKFLGLDYQFLKDTHKEYPFSSKLEKMKFMWGYVIIPRYGIEKIIQNKISDKEFRNILKEITMLVQVPFSNDGKVGVIAINVSLSFRYDKTYKYGDINKSIEEVCYAIEKYGKRTNDFYIIDDCFHEFMSYFVMNNQWGIGSLEVISQPEIKFDNNFKEIREDDF